jgi:hypothetical protein
MRRSGLRASRGISGIADNPPGDCQQETGAVEFWAMWRRILSLLLALVLSASAAQQHDTADTIASLIDPAKLSTLKARGAIPRVQKIVYQLEMARRDGANPGAVINSALRRVGMTNALAAKFTKNAMLRNLTIASRLGCLNAEGLQDMKTGKSPTIRAGPYKGEQVSVDHIIPLKVAPELDHVIANLELLPLRLNERKNAKIGNRQRDLAAKLYQAELLSAEGYQAVRDHK